MKRRFDPNTLELMDRPQPVSAELERDLDNLRKLNRWVGSYSLIKFFLGRWVKPGARLRILDLATGSGDIPRLIADYAHDVGAEVRIDALDQQPATLQIARKLSAAYPSISFIEGNILEWGEPDTYDIVLCTLALHHFSEDDAVQVLPDDPMIISLQGVFFAMTGKAEPALECLTRACAIPKSFGHAHHSYYQIACILALLDRTKGAFEWLERSVDAGFGCWPLFLRDPSLERLRALPEFEVLISALQARYPDHLGLL